MRMLKRFKEVHGLGRVSHTNVKMPLAVPNTHYAHVTPRIYRMFLLIFRDRGRKNEKELGASMREKH